MKKLNHLITHDCGQTFAVMYQTHAPEHHATHGWDADVVCPGCRRSVHVAYRPSSPEAGLAAYKATRKQG